MKHKYHTNETYKEYQKTKALQCYQYRSAIKDEIFFEAMANKGI